MFLVFDTETTGLPKRWDAPISDHENWPRCVQIAWQLHDDFGNCVEHKDFIVSPEGFDIPFESEQIHGISTALSTKEGSAINAILADFNAALAKSKYIIGHNIKFDVNIIGAELDRLGLDTSISTTPILDTDTDGNGEFTVDFKGEPLEPYGFSLNPEKNYQETIFEDIAFDMQKFELVEIKLK